MRAVSVFLKFHHIRPCSPPVAFRPLTPLPIVLWSVVPGSGSPAIIFCSLRMQRDRQQLGNVTDEMHLQLFPHLGGDLGPVGAVGFGQ